jgi:hypothetical protein
MIKFSMNVFKFSPYLSAHVGAHQIKVILTDETGKFSEYWFTLTVIGYPKFD